MAEYADVETLFVNPRHPYTLGLFRSLPDLDSPRGGRLPTIPGMVPSPLNFPTGCRFRTRCPYATKKCSDDRPLLRPVAGNMEHVVACHYADEVAAGSKEETGPYLDGRIVRKYETESGIEERAQEE